MRHIANRGYRARDPFNAERTPQSRLYRCNESDCEKAFRVPIAYSGRVECPHYESMNVARIREGRWS
jgi:hypothetical protein